MDPSSSSLMSKTIFVSYISAFGGVERLILSLSRYLHDQRIAHSVVCFSDTLGLAKHAEWPLEIKELRPLRNSLREALALRRFFKGLDSTAGQMPLLFDLKGAFYAGLANLKDFALHLTDPPSLLSCESSRASFAFAQWNGQRASVSLQRRLVGEAVHRINKRGVRRAVVHIVMTNSIKRELHSLYGVDSNVIRPGVAKTSAGISQKGKPQSSGLRMLSVSRLERSKRLDVIVQALHQLRAGIEAPDEGWTLDIAGAGPARQDIEHLVASLGTERFVRLRGRVSESILEDLYSEADVFVMPAVQGYGLPALEALARRVPVVLHEDSGVSEILRGSPWVEIISETNDLAKALIRLQLRINGNQLTSKTLPEIPTDEQWAEQICRACSWFT